MLNNFFMFLTNYNFKRNKKSHNIILKFFFIKQRNFFIYIAFLKIDSRGFKKWPAVM